MQFFNNEDSNVWTNQKDIFSILFGWFYEKGTSDKEKILVLQYRPWTECKIECFLLGKLSTKIIWRLLLAINSFTCASIAIDASLIGHLNVTPNTE